jgi:3-methyl-2-oxobutanoate hydroxymethyltransferase
LGNKPFTVEDLFKKKENNEPVVGITAYNYSIARIADEVGIDWILIGDSVGNNEMGYTTTIPVTMEDMLVFTKGVVRGVKRALVIGDMPFLSFQTSPERAVENAGKFMRLGVSGVKVEGARNIQNIKAIINAGIPVMGHVGLNPQYYFQIGRYKVYGKEKSDWEAVMKSAKVLEEVGVFSIILEAMVPELAKKIRDSVSIPVYGIGAGKEIDGQILIVNDILGLSFGFKPKFVKQYVNLEKIIYDAMTQYKNEVIEGTYPDIEHTY